MTAPKKRRPGVRIDMTPMVDVAFLLLIFFMSTTQFKPPEQVGVTLPVSTSEVHVPEANTIILTVNGDGEIFISSERLTDIQAVAAQDLATAIMNWRARNPGAVVIIKGDKDVEFSRISGVMDALGRANTLRFNLMTDLKRREPVAAGR
jgi:biopolymer transport protein ExbD